LRQVHLAAGMRRRAPVRAPARHGVAWRCMALRCAARHGTAQRSTRGHGRSWVVRQRCTRLRRSHLLLGADACAAAASAPAPPGCPAYCNSALASLLTPPPPLASRPPTRAPLSGPDHLQQRGQVDQGVGHVQARGRADLQARARQILDPVGAPRHQPAGRRPRRVRRSAAAPRRGSAAHRALREQGAGRRMPSPPYTSGALLCIRHPPSRRPAAAA
jgi:hypothetical protein